MSSPDPPKVEISTMTSVPGQGGAIATSEVVGAKVESLRYVFRKMTWPLFGAWMITALINIIFGYETTAFSGVQSIPAFAKEFGTQTGPNQWALSAKRASYTSSSAFSGKLVGSLVGYPPQSFFSFGYMFTRCLDHGVLG